MEYQIFTLENGIRLVHCNNNREVAHCGIILNTGSRDEKARENGIAHFIEHVIFKGTGKRKTYHVLSRLENIGADINAYTSKEETCLHASFLHPHYERTLELFSDIVFNSVFPEKEIKKEKEVVLDEINACKENPPEEIYDEFEGLLFKGHPMARNILGTAHRVRRFSREDILQFIQHNFHTDQIVISSIGNIAFEKVKALVQKYFSHIPPNYRCYSRTKFNNYIPAEKILNRRNHLSHCCMGNLAYPKTHGRRLGMALLNNLLGGPVLNSRLNLAIREKHGYAYNVESNYQAYTDTGVFCVYIATDKSYLYKSVNLIKKELALLRNKKLGVLQLKRAKQQVYGQIAISMESPLQEMLSIGKSLLQLHKVETIKEIMQAIETIRAEELLEIANEIFAPEQISTLIYKEP